MGRAKIRLYFFVFSPVTDTQQGRDKFTVSGCSSPLSPSHNGPDPSLCLYPLSSGFCQSPFNQLRICGASSMCLAPEPQP